MQARMKEHQLTADQIVALLDKAPVGHLGTVDEKGFPYVTPVHFVHLDGSIYFHGLARGRKLANLAADPKVCFEVAGEHSYIQADAPCDTNTAYRSVIITGRPRRRPVSVRRMSALSSRSCSRNSARLVNMR